MLSIEEIKLLIEKLEKVKKVSLKNLINTNLAILRDIEFAVDANNQSQIDRIDKTERWYRKDIEFKKEKPFVDPLLYRTVQTKIYQFAKTNIYNSLEIGPGSGYLGALIMQQGWKYYSTEVTQAFYLYQNHNFLLLHLI